MGKAYHKEQDRSYMTYRCYMTYTFNDVAGIRTAIRLPPPRQLL